jgi:uncharacterized membrane protein YvbJ
VNKLPRFFCDNCGYEVGHEVKACPHCGRFFASVRCPSCGFSGQDKMFFNGCPMCGYSADISQQKRSLKKVKSRNKTTHHFEPLPPWAYVLAFLAMFAAVAFLSWFITR